MTEFELTPDEVEVVQSKRSLSQDEIEEIATKCVDLIKRECMVHCGYYIGRNDLTESDLKTVRGLYCQAEREAALRGEKWEVMP
jgi:hypothetical protein